VAYWSVHEIGSSPIIRDAMCPHLEMGENLQVAEAKKAIKDYKKATNEGTDAIELMMYYVECGNKFTLRYGDIDAKFYDSIIAIYADIVVRLENSNDEKLVSSFLPRLQEVARTSDGIGWGYHDDIAHFLKQLMKSLGR
jgi:hypothetical protein